MTREQLVGVLQSLGIDSANNKQVCAMLDAAEQDGKIDIEVFLKMAHGLMQPIDDKDVMRKTFDALDEDNDGVVPIEDMLKVMDGLGERLTHDETLKMLQEADTNGDGFLTFDEFCGMVLRNRS